MVTSPMEQHNMKSLEQKMLAWQQLAAVRHRSSEGFEVLSLALHR